MCSGDKDEKIPTGSKNELRRKGICFICKRLWATNLSCSSDMEQMTGTKQEEIHSNHSDEDSSIIVDSIDLQEEIHEEYENSSVDEGRSPPVHPCLTTEEDEQQIVSTSGEIQGEDI